MRPYNELSYYLKTIIIYVKQYHIYAIWTGAFAVFNN